MADKDPHLQNAVAAEPAKTLAGAIQQVMSKAITSPTDGKVDFAQGINPVSGDPHQKSAGAADTAKAVSKEEKEEDKEKEEVQETSHEDEKEVKKEAYGSKKESSHEDEKEKEEVKEGEMPQAALDALKKSKEKDEVKEEDEKEDEKKDKEEVKEADEKDDEKKDEVKEEDEKDDEKKDVKENDEEEKSAKDKVKDIDMKEDVAALTDGEDLSEEFKAKAATIFESAVKAKLVEEIEKLESEYETKVNEQVASVKEEIVEKVDAYLNYVVSEWIKENELAIEKGLRTEIAEDFIGGLKSLFESHYIEVPQEKYNVIEDQAVKIDELTNKLNESIQQNVELNQKIGEFAREEILQDVASDLAETEKEKFKGLTEGIEYKNAADFRKKADTIKESYFPRKKATVEESNDVAGKADYSNLEGSMAAYAAAISKTKKNPYFKK